MTIERHQRRRQVPQLLNARPPIDRLTLGSTRSKQAVGVEALGIETSNRSRELEKAAAAALLCGWPQSPHARIFGVDGSSDRRQAHIAVAIVEQARANDEIN